MKKICSLALVLCMLLALVAVPTAAETAPEHITFKDTDTTYTDSEGVVYNIIRDKEDFLAIENGKNYIFADNINLDKAIDGTAAINGTWASGVIDGNGYSVYGYHAVNGGTQEMSLFNFKSTTATATFKNISFGNADNHLQLVKKGNGGLGAVIGKVASNSQITFINCDVYVSMDGPSTSDPKANGGGFIGNVNSSNVSIVFEDCNTYGTIVGKNKHGGFIGGIESGKTGCSISFKNCTNNVSLNCQVQGTGGFIGQINTAGIAISLENCVNNGNITGTDKDVGGLIGYCLTPNLTVVNCKNNGTVKTADGVTCGTMIGRTNTSTAVSIVVPVSEVDSLAGAVGCKNKPEEQPDAAVTLMANGNGTASAGWQKTTADDNGNVKVRLLVAVSDEYLEEIQTMTFTGTFGLTAGGSKTLTMTLGGDKPVKYYSSVVAAGETLVAAEGYVLIPVVVENIPEADWDGTVSMKLTATGSDNVVAYYQYN